MGQVICIIVSLFLALLGLVFRKLHKDNIWIDGERLKNNRQAAILSLLACAMYAGCVGLLVLSTRLG